MGAIIGIDLGTTTSEIAVYKDKKPVLIENDRGSRITPSVVAISQATRQLLVGEDADSLQGVGVVREIKRKMGTGEKVTLGDRDSSPEEISSLILRFLKSYAETRIGEEIVDAVITVPANFSIEARKATEIAAELAGLKPLRIIQEPTAAALAYGANAGGDAEEIILVYDLGGGTFDVSIVEVFDQNIDVKAHDGDRSLGGKDFDERLVAHVQEYLINEHKIDCSNDIQQMDKLKRAAKETKEILSFNPKTTLSIPFFAVKDNQPFNLELSISRATFDTLTEDLQKRTITLTESALKKAKCKKADIKKVLLVGGSTRMPWVKTALKDFFGFEPSDEVEPDYAVAMGACIQASIIKGETDSIIMDKVAYGFGVESAVEIDGVLIPGFYAEIISPNTPMLQPFTEVFSTVRDDQTRVEISCFQREPSNNSDFARDCENIGGTQMLNDIPIAKAGEEKIEVTMVYNLNGIIDMTAHILSSGKKEKFEIQTAAGRLNESEGANQKADLDRLWKNSKFADKAASLINSVEKRIDEMSEEDAAKVQEIIGRLKNALVKEEAEEIEEYIDQITDILINY